MKKIICEMCGGSKFVKSDGMYVCESCGMKYTLEEARSLMQEDGESQEEARQTEVTVNPAEQLKNLYIAARRARDDENSKLAQNYYQKVLEYEPNSWEAYFYCTYFEVSDTNIANISSAAIKLYNCIDTVLSQIKQHVEPDKINKTLQEVIDRTAKICSSMTNAALNHYDASIRGSVADFTDRTDAIRSVYFKLYDCLIANFPDFEATESNKLRLLVCGANCINYTSALKGDKNFMSHVEQLIQLSPAEYENTVFYKLVEDEKKRLQAQQEEAELERRAAEAVEKKEKEKYEQALKDYPTYKNAFIMSCILHLAILGIHRFYLAAKAEKGKKGKQIALAIVYVLTCAFMFLGWFYDMYKLEEKWASAKNIINEYESEHNITRKKA